MCPAVTQAPPCLMPCAASQSESFFEPQGPVTAHRASRRAVAHGILTASPGADAAIPPLYRRVSEAGAGADAQPPGWIPAGLTSRGASGPSEPLLLR